MTQRLAASSNPSPQPFSATTSRLGLNKPAVGADMDVWGGLWNANADILDAAVTFANPNGQINGPIGVERGAPTAHGASPDQLFVRALSLGVNAGASGVAYFNAYYDAAGTPRYIAGAGAAQIDFYADHLDFFVFPDGGADAVLPAAAASFHLGTDGIFTVNAGQVRVAPAAGAASLHLYTQDAPGVAGLLFVQSSSPGTIWLALADGTGAPAPGGVAQAGFALSNNQFFPASGKSSVNLYGNADTDSGLSFTASDRLAYNGSIWAFVHGATLQTWGDWSTGYCYTAGKFISYGLLSEAPASAEAYRIGLPEVLRLAPVMWSEAGGLGFAPRQNDLIDVLPDCLAMLPANMQRAGRIAYLDERPLLYALVNAVKDLKQELDDANTRVDALIIAYADAEALA